MADLKENFREWLINQNLAETTIYEYIRRIDKICNIIYKGHRTQSWQQLAENIYPILGFHLLCRKGEVRITKDNIEPIKNFLLSFLFSMEPYKENLRDYLIVEMRSDSPKLCLNHYTQINDLLPYLTDEAIVFEILVSVNQSNKNRNALEKFYQFLAKTGYTNPASSNYKKLVEKNDIEEYYIKLTKNITDLSSYSENASNSLKLLSRINGGTSIIPPQIDNSADTEAYPDTVREILRISIRTLKRLASSRDLIPLENGNYSIETVNQYIKARFVPSKYHCTMTKVDKWWGVDEAHQQTGIHRKKLQRLRHSNPDENEVAYVRSSPTVYIYYPPDVIRKA